jgi:predicted nucleic acid-binding Zn ribbon protein
MRSSSTRYTSRCSWVMRRDHTSAPSAFSGSGFPVPDALVSTGTSQVHEACRAWGLDAARVPDHSGGEQ